MTGFATAIDAQASPPLICRRLQRMAAEAPERALYTHLIADGVPPVRLTRGDVWLQACAVAQALTARRLRGRPVLLVYPAGKDFGPAFLGTLLAGAIAVPVPEPQFAAQMERMGAIAADCEPGAILLTGSLEAKLDAKLPGDSPLRSCPWLATDASLPCVAYEPSPVDPSDVALLQYTSGSTSTPKGVAVTHGNLACNLDMLAAAFRPEPGARIVSWLPHFHDMGLMAGILAPMGCDGEAILMSPQAFLTRPLRWLQAISDYGATISGGPNFAFERCVRAAERVELVGLDLSGWRTAFAGAEPIRMATLDAFADRFAGCGFASDALTPCYGMAEATLLVTCKPAGATPTRHRLAREAARVGVAESSQAPDALVLTGCGLAAPGTALQIVDARRRVLPTGRIGEIWIAGPQVARGYWRSGEAEDAFAGQLREAPGVRWLRTGDLGFLTQTGELVFVDRLKDLIIVNGQNYACHDLELTAAASHELLSADSCVAISIDAGDKTQVAVVAELAPKALAQADQIAAAVRSRLFSTHALAVSTVAFVAPGRLCRTTSGKLQRRLTADRLADGHLRPLAAYGDPLTLPSLVLAGA